jgi:hypothetical protein
VSGLYTNAQDPENHANEAQHEADPLLDNNDPGWSAPWFILFVLRHFPRGTRCALAVEVSNISIKTAGGTAGALNPVSTFGCQSSAYP